MCVPCVVKGSGLSHALEPHKVKKDGPEELPSGTPRTCHFIKKRKESRKTDQEMARRPERVCERRRHRHHSKQRSKKQWYMERKTVSDAATTQHHDHNVPTHSSTRETTPNSNSITDYECSNYIYVRAVARTTSRSVLIASSLQKKNSAR